MTDEGGGELRRDRGRKGGKREWGEETRGKGKEGEGKGGGGEGRGGGGSRKERKVKDREGVKRGEWKGNESI